MPGVLDLVVRGGRLRVTEGPRLPPRGSLPLGTSAAHNELNREVLVG
jgi:hypothetical protein